MSLPFELPRRRVVIAAVAGLAVAATIGAVAAFSALPGGGREQHVDPHRARAAVDVRERSLKFGLRPA